MSSTLFQYCQKIVVLSQDKTKVLLAKRKGEADYDEVFSFIGGKMETTDESIIAGLQREKNEEIGTTCKIGLYPSFSTNLLFRKKDGNSMILPHYLAVHQGGDIVLSDEYSEYRWVPIDELPQFEPKIETIPQSVEQLLSLLPIVERSEQIVL